MTHLSNINYDCSRNEIKDFNFFENEKKVSDNEFFVTRLILMCKNYVFLFALFMSVFVWNLSYFLSKIVYCCFN